MPPLVLTVGDPAGIGPELTVAAFSELRGTVPFVVLGDVDQLRALGVATGVEVAEIGSVGDAVEGRLSVLHRPWAAIPVPGEPDAKNAPQVVENIRDAVALTQSGEASGIVTAPISKAVLIDGAEFGYPGHTEFLAALDGKTRSVMMLAGPGLRAVPVTIHIALAEVPGALTADLLEETIRITEAALRTDFGIADPRLAVAGLNPHAGEDGKMGREEIEVITPVLKRLRAEGMAIAGPISADTMFHDRARATYDTAIAMYHDQALIPLKTLHFDDGVNVTLGLSFIRTSPDHGTAFDIAGKGIANPASLIAAIRMAGEMAARRAGA